MIKLSMPGDVRTYVLDYQGKKRTATGNGHFSQQHAICAIIRDHKDLIEENANLKTQMQMKIDHKNI